MNVSEIGTVTAVILSVLGIVAYLARGVSLVRRQYARIPFRRRLLYNDLERINAGFQVESVTTILGPPKLKDRKGSYWEYVYEKRDCFVQVIADESDKVLLYAVTARDSEFHPPTWVTRARWSPRPEPGDSRLGCFGFDEIGSIDDPPGGVIGWCGANRWRYIESYWYGRPGNFQTFLLALNDAGHVWDGMDSLSQISRVFVGKEVELGHLLWVDRRPYAENERKPEESEDQWEAIQVFLRRPDIQAWRKMKPNTYAVTAPNVSIADLLQEGRFSIGADQDQVRLLP